MAQSLSQMLIQDANKPGPGSNIASDVSKGAALGIQLATAQEDIAAKKMQVQEQKNKLLDANANFQQKWWKKMTFASNDAAAKRMLKAYRAEADRRQIPVNELWGEEFLERREEFKGQINVAAEMLSKAKVGSPEWQQAMQNLVGMSNDDSVNRFSGELKQLADMKLTMEAQKSKADTEAAKARATERRTDAMADKAVTDAEIAKSGLDLKRQELSIKRTEADLKKLGVDIKSKLADNTIKKDSEAHFIALEKVRLKEEELDLEKTKLDTDRANDLQEARDVFIKDFNTNVVEKSNGVKSKVVEFDLALTDLNSARSMFERARNTNNVQMYNQAAKQLIASVESRISDQDFRIIASRAGIFGYKDQIARGFDKVPDKASLNLIAVIEEMHKNTQQKRVQMTGELNQQLVNRQGLRGALPLEAMQGMVGLKKEVPSGPDTNAVIKKYMKQKKLNLRALARLLRRAPTLEERELLEQQENQAEPAGGE